MDRGAWQATVHGVAELGMTERLSTFAEGPFKVRSKPVCVPGPGVFTGTPLWPFSSGLREETAGHVWIWGA